ncbi:MAG: DegV family protein [Enterococcaceae bacterium]|jgi:DegV family protein with EDD domain|nr:DegV family protein [Enterococcaceae bacterium]
MSFKILTDSCCDLPYDFMKQNDIDFVSMTIEMSGKSYSDDMGKSFNLPHYYEKLKAGVMPSTSQVNIGEYLEFFRPYAEKKEKVMYLAFSSGMSGSYQNAVQALEVLKEDFPDAAISVVDTKAACLGEGLLVYQAVQLRNDGHSFEETLQWIEEYKYKLWSWVTVDDLKHLERGGRISKPAAAFGSLISVKPIIYVDRAGHLEAVEKVRGRKRSLQRIADKAVEGIVKPLKQTLFIACAGDFEAGEEVKKMIESEIQVHEIIVLPMGPTISAHTGFGCVAVFSFGHPREK